MMTKSDEGQNVPDLAGLQKFNLIPALVGENVKVVWAKSTFIFPDQNVSK
jgi:hypothetical protein